jgi:hypothetical protein
MHGHYTLEISVCDDCIRANVGRIAIARTRSRTTAERMTAEEMHRHADLTGVSTPESKFGASDTTGKGE